MERSDHPRSDCPRLSESVHAKARSYPAKIHSKPSGCSLANCPSLIHKFRKLFFYFILELRVCLRGFAERRRVRRRVRRIPAAGARSKIRISYTLYNAVAEEVLPRSLDETQESAAEGDYEKSKNVMEGSESLQAVQDGCGCTASHILLLIAVPQEVSWQHEFARDCQGDRRVALCVEEGVQSRYGCVAHRSPAGSHGARMGNGARPLVRPPWKNLAYCRF